MQKGLVGCGHSLVALGLQKLRKLDGPSLMVHRGSPPLSPPRGKTTQEGISIVLISSVWSSEAVAQDDDIPGGGTLAEGSGHSPPPVCGIRSLRSQQHKGLRKATAVQGDPPLHSNPAVCTACPISGAPQQPLASPHKEKQARGEFLF